MKPMLRVELLSGEVFYCEGLHMQDDGFTYAVTRTGLRTTGNVLIASLKSVTAVDTKEVFASRET